MEQKKLAKFLVLLVTAVFCLGWITNDVLSYIDQKFNSDSPLDVGVSPERQSPSDWIKNDNIHVYSDRIVIDVKDPQWAVFTDTNSMDPLFDSNSNGLEIVPQTSDQIQVGDVISYKSLYSSGTIIHRVVQKGVDDKGVYFIMRGDNNKDNDPGKVRFEQVQRVLIGVLY